MVDGPLNPSISKKGRIVRCGLFLISLSHRLRPFAAALPLHERGGQHHLVDLIIMLVQLVHEHLYHVARNVVDGLRHAGDAWGVQAEKIVIVKRNNAYVTGYGETEFLNGLETAHTEVFGSEENRIYFLL